VEGSCEHGNKRSGSAVKFLSSCTIDGFSSRAQLRECRKVIHMTTAFAGAVVVIRRHFHNLYSSLNTIRVIKWAGYRARMIIELI
jgi:hypothetical protein